MGSQGEQLEIVLSGLMFQYKVAGQSKEEIEPAQIEDI